MDDWLGKHLPDRLLLLSTVQFKGPAPRFVHSERWS